ncbi:MAG: ankyrin repeat domain-containing protein [Candidatus Solibacter sp.]
MSTRPNLEYYRKQAKALLHAARKGEPTALQRLAFVATEPKLHDAQRAIAREQGFRSWPRFLAWLTTAGAADEAAIKAFIDAATSDRRQADELLRANPALAHAGFHTALVLGDALEVEQALADAPGLATAPGGPDSCAPLIYTCFSRYAGVWSERAAGVVETARVLLRSGADPNSAMDSEYGPLSCLYAASGVNNNPALTQLLLEAGANPNDGESLYHSTEHPGLVCCRLLLQYGARVPGSNALKHMLDRNDNEGLRLLLGAGGDPNELNPKGETALHWAVWRGRDAAAITALLDAGAAIDARRQDGRTAYALATQSGQREIAALLAARGADPTLSPVDRFLVHGGPPPAGLADAPEHRSLLADLASSHRTQEVKALLSIGMPIDAPGEHGATALHWACWKGYADLVELLLAHGAPLAARDASFGGTPPGWFGHGVRNCHERGGDYPQVARLLIAAGAEFPPADLPTGNPKVDGVLREHGLIP